MKQYTIVKTTEQVITVAAPDILPEDLVLNEVQDQQGGLETKHELEYIEQHDLPPKYAITAETDYAED